MRALVTGAAGFVGANLVRHLLQEGHEVHLTVRRGGDRWRLAALEAAAEHDVDLAAPGAAVELVERVSPQWVFHLAAHGAYSWQTDARRICEDNLIATIELARAAERAGVTAFVHAGSSSEYGFKDHPANENERVDPNSAYAVSKVAATHYCRHRAHQGSLPAVTLRLYSVYGAMEDRRRLVWTLLSEGLCRRLPPLVSPETARDFVYVGDVCEAFVLAAERAGQVGGAVYNVGGARQITLRELVRHVRELLEIACEPSWETHEQREWDTDRWCADTSRIAAELGWAAKTDIRTGLRRMLDSVSATVVPRRERDSVLAAEADHGGS